MYTYWQTLWGLAYTIFFKASKDLYPPELIIFAIFVRFHFTQAGQGGGGGRKDKGLFGSSKRKGNNLRNGSERKYIKIPISPFFVWLAWDEDFIYFLCMVATFVKNEAIVSLPLLNHQCSSTTIKNPARPFVSSHPLSVEYASHHNHVHAPPQPSFPLPTFK